MFLISIENNRANKAVVSLWLLNICFLLLRHTELSVTTVMLSVEAHFVPLRLSLWLSASESSRSVEHEWASQTENENAAALLQESSWTGEQAGRQELLTTRPTDLTLLTRRTSSQAEFADLPPHPTDDEMRLKINIILAACNTTFSSLPALVLIWLF